MTSCDKMLLAYRLLDMVTTKTKIVVKSHENQIWKLKMFFSWPSQIGHPLAMKQFMFVEVDEEQSRKICSKHSHADL